MTEHAHVLPIYFLDQLAAMQPSSRDDLIAQIQTIIGSSLTHTIDTHNTASVLFIFHFLEPFSNLNRKYILKAEHGSETATEKEIDWYSKAKKYDFVPKQIFSSISEMCSLLLLEFIEGTQTLDDIESQNKHSPSSSYYKKVIEFDRKLYHDSAPRVSTLDEMDKFYIGKFRQRFQESTQFDYLTQLHKKDAHVINGKQYHPLYHYVETIHKSPALRDCLIPRQLGFIHGDLHGGNILVTAEQQVYLVDPNGTREMPLEYDFGKLLHTVHGRYPALMNGSYILDQDDKGFIFELETIQTKAYTDVKKLLNDSELVRGLYAEAMHFATMLPHHAANQRETIALFLRAIELFDELYYIMDIK